MKNQFKQHNKEKSFLLLFGSYITKAPYLQFNIRAIKRGEKGISKDYQRLTETVLDEYHTYNLTGYDIYFRPKDYRFIMVDLDKYNSKLLHNVIDNYYPFVITQTSQYKIDNKSYKNYQAWFYVPKSITADDYVYYAQYLTKKLNGDMKSAKKNQVGRLINFINRKPGRGKRRLNIVYTKKGAVQQIKKTPSCVI
jgi:hypothetical protein